MTVRDVIAACENKIPVELADGSVWLVASVNYPIASDGRIVLVDNPVVLIPLQGQNDGQPKHVGEDDVVRYHKPPPQAPPQEPARVTGFGDRK